MYFISILNDKVKKIAKFLLLIMKKLRIYATYKTNQFFLDPVINDPALWKSIIYRNKSQS